MAEYCPFLNFTAIRAKVRIQTSWPTITYPWSVRTNSRSEGDCPLPSHTSGSKNTFYANEAKGAWYCHSDSCKKNGNRAGETSSTSLPVWSTARSMRRRNGSTNFSRSDNGPGPRRGRTITRRRRQR